MRLNLRIALWNANGITNHTREIEIFLQTNYIDILLVSETHMTSRSFFKINSYDFLHTNHPDDKAHAGSGILIKSTIKYEKLNGFQENYLQATCIKLKCNDGDLIVSSIYFPPRHTVHCKNYEDFFNTLGVRFIVGGDFNAKHPWWGSRLVNPKGTELYKCLVNKNLSALSTGSPTHWPSDPRKNPDLLDFIVYKGIQNHKLEIRSSNELSSDHTPVLLNYNVSVQLSTPRYHVLSSNTNIPLFQQYLDDNVNLNINIKSDIELDEAVEHFTKEIHNAANFSTPILNTSSQQHFSNFDVSLEIRQLISEKRRLRKRWQISRNSFDKRLFNKSCKDLKILLNKYKNAKTSQFLEEINNSRYDEHLLWKATKFLKRPTKKDILLKKSDGSWCRTDKDTAETFATHLKNTFVPFSFNTTTQQEEISDFLNCPLQMDFPIKFISLSEVRNQIRMLNKKKSPGYDLIDGNVISKLTHKCIVFLTLIYNSIIRLNHFPSQWKCAEIIMIQKPNKPGNSVTSFRPISLLSIFSKIFEKIFLRRLSPVLESKNIIPEHQFGFRHKHGTPEQIHRIVNNITDALEKKRYCSAVFLDIQQAFDRVWHMGLLYKIKKLMPAPFYLFFKSYLSERHFYVKINDETSELYAINAGIPQGSVLGPILYTIYTADMPVLDNVMVATYADDTAIMATSDSPDEASLFVQNEINELDQWLKKWNVKVNCEKSQHTTFTLKRQHCPPITLNGNTIPKSDTVKYLGMALDRRLTWKNHIKNKRNQLNIKTKKLYWLLGPKSQLNLNNKLRIYKVILKPVWSYGIQLWGTASNSNIDILERYQSKTLRQITNAPWFVTNRSIRNDLTISSVRSEISTASERYLQRLSDHINPLAISLLDSTNETRRLKRSHVLDLPFRK